MIEGTLEEILKTVPVNIREAGLGLGLPRWKVTLRIVVMGSMKPIMTGIMLAVARAAGETAPLIFTSFNNSFWSTGLDQPIASLPVQIYTYSISPYDDWHAKAMSAALILILFVFSINLIARFVMKGPGGK
jgi:phosphate transport system permease protein